MDHAFFGTLPPSGRVEWRRDVDLGSRRIAVDMICDMLPSTAQLDDAAALVGDLARLDAVARAALDPTNGEVALYVEHHIEQLGEQKLVEVFGTAALLPERFLAKLVLKRVGLYPSSHRAVFDYTLEGDVTQYVLAVSLSDGAVRGIAMES